MILSLLPHQLRNMPRWLSTLVTFVDGLKALLLDGFWGAICQKRYRNPLMVQELRPVLTHSHTLLGCSWTLQKGCGILGISVAMAICEPWLLHFGSRCNLMQHSTITQLPLTNQSTGRPHVSPHLLGDGSCAAIGWWNNNLYIALDIPLNKQYIDNIYILYY